MSYAVCQQRWWIQSYFDGKLIVNWLPMKIVTCIEVTQFIRIKIGCNFSPTLFNAVFPYSQYEGVEELKK